MMYDELIQNLRKMGKREYCAIASAEDFPAMQFVKQAANAIEELSKERKHGKWEFDNPITADYMCSVCLGRNDVCTPFCPNCGADMGWWSDDDV